jgi:hypothetical protein
MQIKGICGVLRGKFGREAEAGYSCSPRMAFGLSRPCGEEARRSAELWKTVSKAAYVIRSPCRLSPYKPLALPSG